MSLPMLSQVEIKGPWNIACGASSYNAFQRSYSYNIRYISPRFRWSEEYIEEEEKHPEKFRNTRLMFELIYTPPKKVICTGFNLQSRLLNYKRFSFEIVGGFKFFFVPGPDFINIPYLKAGREIWYATIGMLCQFDLGIILPFAEFGGDKIITIGSEFNFLKIYKKPKSRYQLHSRST